MSSQIDVLVCGAGPVGLLTANLLHQHGLSFRIIEKKPMRTTYSGGLALWKRTLEILETRQVGSANGLAEDIVTQSVFLQHLHIRQPGVDLGRIPMVLHDTALPPGIILPQYETERIFEEHLVARTRNKAIVERSTELISYTQTADSVQSVVRSVVNPDKTEIITSRYIIGADGVHSPIRKGVPDWKFDGKSYPVEFVVADVKVDPTVLNPRDLTVWLTSQGAFAFLPLKMEEDMLRIVIPMGEAKKFPAIQDDIDHGLQATSDRSKSPLSELNLEDLQQIADQRLAPDKIKMDKVTWTSHFKINERKANGYRRGRAFLVGDAAHCHSPAGGQGMNMGMQDAHNLVWKLAQVVKGTTKEPEHLLDSYSVEREPIAEKVLSSTGEYTSCIMANTYIAKTILESIAPVLLKVPQVRAKIVSTVTGSFIYYSQSPLNVESKSLKQQKKENRWLPNRLWRLVEGTHLILPGRYCPDAALSSLQDGPLGPLVRFNSLLKGRTNHTIIVFADHARLTPENNPLVRFVSNLCLRNKEILSLTIVGLSSSVVWYELKQLAEQGLLPYMFADPGGRFHQAIGVPVGLQAVVILRPDGYVCFAGLAANGGEDALQDEVAQWTNAYFN